MTPSEAYNKILALRDEARWTCATTNLSHVEAVMIGQAQVLDRVLEILKDTEFKPKEEK